MKRYKVQWAYAVDIGVPAIHNNEDAAAGEVAHLLGTWIRRNLTDYLKRLEQRPDQHPEFRESIRFLIPELQRLIGSGQVWQAYELWEDFYVEFENEFDFPLYVGIGAVFVEGSKATGLKNRLPLLERSDVAPVQRYGQQGVEVINRLESLKMEMLEELWEVVSRKAALKGMPIHPEAFLRAAAGAEFVVSKKFHYMDEAAEAQYLAEMREGILRKLFPKLSGMGLGAFKSWLVQYADFGGTLHPGRHSNEERAKAQAGEYLTLLLSHLTSHAAVEAVVGKSTEYVQEAAALEDRINLLLSDDLVWKAYLEYKEFEEKWNYELGPIPLDMAIGTMRVIPTPEPENADR